VKEGSGRGTSTQASSKRESRSQGGEELAIKGNMTRDDDAVGEKIEAPVSLVIRGVPEEKTRRRARGKFVRARHPQLHAVREKKDVRRGVIKCPSIITPPLRMVVPSA
jgi:hypothetical protein